MLTATCVNAGGLLTTRFALGVAEAAIAPGLTVIISMFYKRSEQPLRHAAWFLGNTCAGLFGGLLNYGIGHIQSIAPWKVCFMQDLSRLSLLNEV
jgi:MFS family permease